MNSLPYWLYTSGAWIIYAYGYNMVKFKFLLAFNEFMLIAGDFIILFTINAQGEIIPVN